MKKEKIAEKIEELIDEIKIEFDEGFLDNVGKISNKSAMRRARKSTSELTKMFKEFRKLSNEFAKM